MGPWYREANWGQTPISSFQRTRRSWYARARVLTAMTLYDLKGPEWSASRAGTVAPGREWKGKRSREGAARGWAFPGLTDDGHTFTHT